MEHVIWNKTDPVKTPSGKTYTAEEFIPLRVPYVAQGDEVVMGMVGDVMHSFDSLAERVDHFGIDPELSIDEKLRLIVEGIHREQDPSYDEINEMLDELEREVGV